MHVKMAPVSPATVAANAAANAANSAKQVGTHGGVLPLFVFFDRVSSSACVFAGCMRACACVIASPQRIA